MINGIDSSSNYSDEYQRLMLQRKLAADQLAAARASSDLSTFLANLTDTNSAALKSDAEIKQMNTNGDGKLSASELGTSSNNVSDYEELMLKNKLSVENSAVTSDSSDLSSLLLRASNNNLTNSKVENVIKELDVNGDGKLDANELKMLNNNLPTPKEIQKQEKSSANYDYLTPATQEAAMYEYASFMAVTPEKKISNSFNVLESETGQIKGFSKVLTSDNSLPHDSRSQTLNDDISGLTNANRKGKEEGIQTEKINVASEMIKNGESIERVMAYTKLSKEEIGNIP